MKTKFIEAVDNKDVVSTRIFLADELMLDPRGDTFKEMRDYAENRLDNLYDSDNGKSYSLDSGSWNKDFLNQLSNDLDCNFSRDRLDFYVQVIQVVLADKAAHLNRVEEEKKKRGESVGEFDSLENNQTDLSKEDWYKGLIAGGAIVTVAGLCLSKAALVSLGITGLVVGGYLLYNEKQK